MQEIPRKEKDVHAELLSQSSYRALARNAAEKHRWQCRPTCRLVFVARSKGRDADRLEQVMVHPCGALGQSDEVRNVSQSSVNFAKNADGSQNM